jgi:hypothetical protein
MNELYNELIRDEVFEKFVAEVKNTDRDVGSCSGGGGGTGECGSCQLS